MLLSPFCESWQSINCAAEEQCQGNKAISATICCEQVGRGEGDARCSSLQLTPSLVLASMCPGNNRDQSWADGKGGGLY